MIDEALVAVGVPAKVRRPDQPSDRLPLPIVIGVGEDFPKARMNTLYSFGIDDQDFIVVLESDQLGDFVDAQMRLRETQNSAYTERVTPVFTGLRSTPEEMLERIG